MPVLDVLTDNCLECQLRSFIESAAALPLTQVPACAQPTVDLERLIQQHCFGPCAEAGLWLLARQWDRSHRISQNQHNQHGSYWHGIMHRIEGDYWNSKYWLRQTAGHPVRERLANALSQIAAQLIQSKQSETGPAIPQLGLLNSPETVSEGLVDLVENSVANKSSCTDLVQQICWWEWQLLFQICMTTRS